MVMIKIKTEWWTVQIVLTRNPSIFNIIRWFAGTLGQRTQWPSVWCSKIIFFYNFLQILFKNCFNLFLYFFIIKIKSFETPKSNRNNEKKNNAWRSDAWSMSLSSRRLSKTSILYYRLTDFKSIGVLGKADLAWSPLSKVGFYRKVGFQRNFFFTSLWNIREMWFWD